MFYTVNEYLLFSKNYAIVPEQDAHSSKLLLKYGTFLKVACFNSVRAPPRKTKFYPMMNFQEYLDVVNTILAAEKPAPPYDNADYFQYTKMNGSRMNRWLKQNPVTEETKAIVAAITRKQHWVVITEPWCGDAAHIVPILYLMSRLNEHIDFKLQLRDSGSEIEKYLTNGTRSIPVLIVRDENGNDLFHWGPRPAAAKVVYDALKEKKAGFEETKIALQQVYNSYKSNGIQQEVGALLAAHR